MLTKFIAFAASTFALLQAQDISSFETLSDPSWSSPCYVWDTQRYQTILTKLNVSQDKSQPLRYNEYPAIVTSLKQVLSHDYIDVATKEQWKTNQQAINTVLTRASIKQAEQIFQFIAYDLLVKLVKGIYGNELKANTTKVVNATEISVCFPYANDFYRNILKDLKLVHDDSHPLTDKEMAERVRVMYYGAAVGPGILTDVDESGKKDVRDKVKAELSRVTIKQIDRMFEYVSAHLADAVLQQFFYDKLRGNMTVASPNYTFTYDSVVYAPASEPSSAKGFTNQDIMYLSSALGGCVVVVAVTVAVIHTRKQKKDQAAAAQSVENEVKAIENAEEAKESEDNNKETKPDSPMTACV
ncbi:hypothetical protein AC1031_010016 [Aphanomyces cochlioides]|nr:hypothetical protein AC1031_010016 [Aphanomyces cochlioides]